MESHDYVLKQISTERIRQEALWGPQNHSGAVWTSILMEEVGEVAKAVNEGDESNYIEELIQVAALAVAMIESANRNGLRGKSLCRSTPMSVPTVDGEKNI